MWIVGLLDGILGGYPVVDVECDIVFGSFHEVDSSELAFKMAAIFAVRTPSPQPRSRMRSPGRGSSNSTTGAPNAGTKCAVAA